MAVNFTAADRVGSIGGYIGGISALAGMLGLGGCNAYNMGGCCSENTPVTRYEQEQSQEISKLRSERDSLLISQQTDAKILEVWKEIDKRFSATGQEIASLAANQAVISQKVTDNLAFVDQKIDNTKKEILSYVNATFVPGKLVMPLDAICPAAQPASTTPASQSTAK